MPGTVSTTNLLPVSVPAFENWCRRALLLAMTVVVLALGAAAPWTGLLVGYGEWLGKDREK